MERNGFCLKKNSNNNDADVTGVAPFGVARRFFRKKNPSKSFLLLEFFKLREMK